MSLCQSCGGPIEEDYTQHFLSSDCIEYLGKVADVNNKTIELLVKISDTNTNSLKTLLKAVTTYGEILDKFQNNNQALMKAFEEVQKLLAEIQDNLKS